MRTYYFMRHICDTIKEWQIKIGVQEETIRLYYPRTSLLNLLGLGQNASEKELDSALSRFSEEAAPKLGAVRFSHKEDRYCVEIPKEGGAYVNREIPEPEFLREFLSVITKKGADLGEVRSCFDGFARKRGIGFIEEDETEEGAGHVFYFSDCTREPYVYCVEEGDFGLTYHRFTREDFDRLV